MGLAFGVVLAVCPRDVVDVERGDLDSLVLEDPTRNTPEALRAQTGRQS